MPPIADEHPPTGACICPRPGPTTVNGAAGPASLTRSASRRRWPWPRRWSAAPSRTTSRSGGTPDAAYEVQQRLALGAEGADVFHVMATTLHDTVVTCWAIDPPVHGLFHGLPPQKGKRRFCGTGAHGLRSYDWAWVEVRPCTGRTPPLGTRPPQRCPPRRTSLLHRLLPQPRPPRRADRHRVQPMGHRGMRPGREAGLRSGRLPNPPLPRLAKANMTLAVGTHAYLTGLRARELDTDT